MFVVRGGGGFWAVEFDFSGVNSVVMDFKGQLFAMLVQARELANSLIVMRIVGCADLQLEGTKGGHIILAQVYNVTKEEIEKIVNIFVNNVESQIFTTSWLLFCIDFSYCFAKKNGELIYATQSDGPHKQVL